MGSEGCEGDTHAASHEFDFQRSLGPCCLSSASGWWLASWYTLPVSAYCILITRSKQASWSSFQAVQWQPILCKSLHAESLLGLSSVLLWDILLKIKKFSWVCEDAKVLTWYSDVIKLKIVLVTMNYRVLSTDFRKLPHLKASNTPESGKGSCDTHIKLNFAVFQPHRIWKGSSVMLNR